MTLEQDFQEVIKKNLPQQVGETLKIRLEQADKDANQVKHLTSTVDKLNQEVMKANELLEKYKQYDVRNALLDSREKEIETKEKSLELEQLKYQLQSEKDKTVFSQNIALGLVRNTEYRKTIFDSETSGQPITDGHGYVHYPLPTSKQHISTEIKE